MTVKGLAEAVARRPPHGASTTDSSPNRAVTKTAISGTTIAATDTGLASGGAYFTFVASSDTHIRFGKAAVAASTTSDYMLRAGQPEEFWLDAAEDRYFTAIRDTADGSLYWYRSG